MPIWTGNVTPNNMEGLVQEIRRTFGEGKKFSMMQHTTTGWVLLAANLALEEIQCLYKNTPPHISIVVGQTRYTPGKQHDTSPIFITRDNFVCLTEHCLLVEQTFPSGYQAWCWMREEL